jgi:WhiB family transcriptional regulator, redox-sensing transcriptional regulator
MEPALALPRQVAIDHDDLLGHELRVTQRLTDDALSARVARHARCADSGLDPDQWYPVSIEPARARREAAAAIAVCAGCPVRAQCLELSLRRWDVGQHGVWGGLVATDRAHLRRRWPPDDRGRRRTAGSGMIVRPPFPSVPLSLVQGGDAQ